MLLWQLPNRLVFHSHDHRDGQQEDDSPDEALGILVFTVVPVTIGSTLSTQSAAAEATTSARDEEGQQKAHSYHHQYRDEPCCKLEGSR